MKKTLLKNYWPLYTMIIAITVVMRYFCQAADSDKLLWILAPTARWVSILSGIPFAYLPHMGYVNHLHQFLIAPSCSGSKFMLLSFLMLTLSFLHRMKERKAGYLWFGFSMIFAYVSTILVNGIRITASIYLPVFLEKKGLMKGALTPDRLHTMIGTFTYFLFLCLIYLAAAAVSRYMILQAEKEHAVSADNCLPALVNVPCRNDTYVSYFKLAVPVFWYLLIVLALPFVKRIYRNEWEGFGQYAALILGVCMTIIVVLHFLRLLHRRMHT